MLLLFLLLFIFVTLFQNCFIFFRIHIFNAQLLFSYYVRPTKNNTISLDSENTEEIPQYNNIVSPSIRVILHRRCRLFFFHFVFLLSFFLVSRRLGTFAQNEIVIVVGIYSSLRMYILTVGLFVFVMYSEGTKCWYMLVCKPEEISIKWNCNIIKIVLRRFILHTFTKSTCECYVLDIFFSSHFSFSYANIYVI